MCGIVAYTGKSNAVPYLINSLKMLEYRGYDSAGIAIINSEGISVVKRQGTVSNLAKAINENFCAKTGIGHTRWATHGEPSQINAHPHLSENGVFAVVHNGIIENCAELKAQLKKQGYSFLSDTDTEIISQLLERNYKGDLISCAKDTLKALNGSFALAILHRDSPGKIICAKKDSPLIITKTKDGYAALSDLIAANAECEEYYTLNDGEIAVLSCEGIKFLTFCGENVEKVPNGPDIDFSHSNKKGYEHYMLKEIYEQSDCLYKTINAYIKGDNICFPGFNIASLKEKNIDRIYLVACGSAYHAAVCGKYAFEKLTDIAVSAHIASEFRYDCLPLNSKSLVVLISQSGETADTLASLSLAKEMGAISLSVINVKTSAMAQKSDYVIPTLAGAEISVATTKAYTCQVAVLYMLALFFAKTRNTVEPSCYKTYLSYISYLPELIKNSFRDKENILSLAENIKDSEHIYFIGRSCDYALALEGALKMKEISYIHCEAYPAGELKHGSIALIHQGTPVVAICLKHSLFHKTLNAINEVKSRGAFVVAITDFEHEKQLENADCVIVCENVKDELFTPFHGIVPLQLLSYHTAAKKGLNVDRPRNLAKSVTVE